MNILPTQEWGLGLGPITHISGPCSAETPEQVMETCTQLSQYPVDILRAGIWKPRTRPNSFEGVGSIGLKWLKDAGKATGKPVCAEVANVKHVYEALRSGIDIMWIGARTTTNPFAVQEIADALQGVDVPVMVKNPVNPDLKLWIGAIERIYNAGIRKIAAIHRGFSTYDQTRYRNMPQWEIPIELKQQLPDIQVICDPSHICGNRELLARVAQKAYDLNFDGLMIESHINPDKALSDAKQQVTPQRLGEILAGLKRRKPNPDSPQLETRLEVLREMIDDIDHKLIQTLGERMKIARQIGQYKRENNISILQSSRWRELLVDRLAQARQYELSDDIMKYIFQMVHKESIRHQTVVMNMPEEKEKLEG